MNLSQVEREELNQLLRSSKITIPDFRRTVSAQGTNYSWLQKTLRKLVQGHDTDVSPRLRYLLRL